MDDEQVYSAPVSEKDNLIAEKQRLAEQLGIWGTFNPIEGYKDTEQHKRIEAIDQRLAEIG